MLEMNFKFLPLKKYGIDFVIEMFANGNYVYRNRKAI